jgi:hypothetical protein
LQEPIDDEILNIDEEFNDKLTDFQKLIIIKTFKIEQVQNITFIVHFYCI